MTIATILDKKGRDVFTMEPSSSLSEVVKTLRDKKIGVVLLAEGDRLLGILSERDIVRALSENGASALSEIASSHMTSSVMTCVEGDTVVSVMSRMTSGRFRHMPVMDGTRLVGLVSIGDVVKLRIEETEKEAADMRAYIAAG
ncbi:CBS domain-containing protein [Cohaesibacter celericrescens]|uniref:Inosine-5-monophosphate dehydrogenase n=1 Tax=Cohaesibacter celericrescens TaxID=2067669 RepID=A0A2N5XW26_9HYPH|nr:CBS domain-containing protein [Cohaesibacter celericrescens]PLW78716.1 inosine-5-monophosphate dehydrogenase [Cohaesibacter celericrescens]